LKADILIVEDDYITATVIKKYLEKDYYHIIDIVNTGEKAIAAAKEYKPDLILMDIFLKNSIDGIETSRRIKEIQDIPIIYLTADSSSETIRRAKITEPFGYLLKPIDSSVLITNIELTLQKQYSYNKRILDTLKKANDELEKRVEERTKELYNANVILKSEMKQRELAEEELRKTDKLATIGKMSTVLAHEIRNPLNSIKINADILLETLELTDNQKKRITIIKKEVDRLNNLLKDVLLFSRYTEILPIEFNLPIFLDGISLQLKNSLEKKNIEFKYSSPEIMIKGDVEKIRQVFLNLILNSVDAIKGKGRIEIECQIKDDKNVIILIKDNGIGIENTEKLFEPFYTTKNLGTGLGLPISNNIIKQHKGKLYLVSSKPGETIFAIELNYEK